MKISRGIKVEHTGGSILLDPSFRSEETVLISHAHSDHVRNHTGKTIATNQTLRLAGLSGEGRPYGKPFEEEGFRITLLNAGHVPGSAMILVEDGQSVLYTGDFRPRESLFGRAEHVNCDTIIVEATYGTEKYVFPEPEEEYSQIKEWTLDRLEEGNSVMIGAYALGKAQEVIHSLNNGGIVPVVHPRIAEVTKMTGIPLEFHSTLSEEGADMLAGQFVAIVPPRMVSEETRHLLSVQSKTSVNTAIASGQKFYHADHVFPLSGHADYNDVLEFVGACSPKKVYTTHGRSRELAKRIKDELGIQAEPLDS